eukprot:5536981-Prymnesium_polylepis.1
MSNSRTRETLEGLCVVAPVLRVDHELLHERERVAAAVHLGHIGRQLLLELHLRRVHDGPRPQ